MTPEETGRRGSEGEGVAGAYEILAALGPDGSVSAPALERAVAALAQGAVLAHPTSTVYGLGALEPAGDAAIARLKGRDPGRPLLRLAASVEAIRAAHPDVAWDERAELLARVFWPGGLTLVLRGDSGDVAVRVEAHPVTRALLQELGGRTLSSTSLNRSGRPPARTSEEVRAFLASVAPGPTRVVFLDAGDLPSSRPSTIVSLVESPARLLRVGAVDPAAVAEALGEEMSP